MTSFRPLIIASVLSLGLCACGSSDSSKSSSNGGSSDGAGAGAAAAGDGASHVESRDQLGGGKPNFTPAEAWVVYPPENKMRMANYRVPGTEGDGDGTLVIAAWPSNLGGLEANASRWMTQASIQGSPAELTEDQRWELEVRDFVVTVFHLDAGSTASGGESDAHGAKGTPLMVAYIEKPGSQGCWTVKLTGPSATITRNKADFETFLKGL